MEEIRILMAVDNPEREATVRKTVETVPGTCTIQVSASEEAFLEALDTFLPTIILADYHLSAFTGRRALDLSLSRSPEIPFIFFNGSINRNIAADCIKAGAWNYIIKEHTERIGSAIQSALEEKRQQHEKQKAAEALARAGREWRATFDAMGEAIFVLDRAGLVRRANRAFKELTEMDWEALIGAPCSALFPSSLEGTIKELQEKTLTGKQKERRELSFGNRTFIISTYPYDLEGSGTTGSADTADTAEAIMVMHDITAQKQLEKKLERSEARYRKLYNELKASYKELQETREMVLSQSRLQAMGQIASGIAHDINNTLVPASLYLDALLEKPGELTEKGNRYLSTIRKSIQDIEHVVIRLRAFYKREGDGEAEEREALVTGELFSDVMEMTQPRWKDISNREGSLIHLKQIIEPKADAFHGTRSELREALINLVLNSADAMPDGGTITLKASHIQEGSEASVSLEVIDTGTGMDEEVRIHCLEPFYTTKGGRGSGLGLPGVYGFVNRSGGRMEVESSPGKGTTVRMILPQASSELARRVSSPGREQHTRERGRPLNILLVDDDERVLQVMKEMLIMDRHEVSTCLDGASALERFGELQEAGSGPDLMISDLGMPGMDGLDLSTRMKELSPEIPIILLTGWGHFMEEDEIPPAVDMVLAKPVSLPHLREAIGQLLS